MFVCCFRGRGLFWCSYRNLCKRMENYGRTQRSAWNTGHTPVHNLSAGDVVITKTERSVYSTSRTIVSSLPGDLTSELFFLRDFDRLGPYKSDTG
jgi:hypothetical protein